MPKNQLWFSQVMIVVAFIVISVGLSTFSLFTQQEFRTLIGWGKYTEYEVDQAPKMPAPHGDSTEIKNNDNHKGRLIQISWKDKILGTINDSIQNNKKSWITILIITATIILAFLYFKKKKVTKSISNVRSIQKPHTETTTKTDETNHDIRSIHNEIRQELIKWENNLPKHNRRKPYETVQQWLLRLNKPANIIPIYEKVRYGEKEYSASDLELVKLWAK
ncbi:hypothetical protein M3215_06215 [Bacillus cytotoxicus]|uniref:Uncharacterized protein n=1 Tax=Bacillus cytotoxicus TaxID=580165 RepID=A0ACC6A3U5_9BACI|nr:hypothetical protein [Bacillus cytotoxicus]